MVVMAAKPCERTEHHWVFRFKWQNCLVFELYLSKVVTKNKKTKNQLLFQGKKEKGEEGKGKRKERRQTSPFVSRAGGWACHAWRHAPVITRGGTAVAEEAERWNNRGHLFVLEGTTDQLGSCPTSGLPYSALCLWDGFEQFPPCFIAVYLLLYGCIQVCLLSYLWRDTWVVSSLWLVWQSCYKTPCIGFWVNITYFSRVRTQKWDARSYGKYTFNFIRNFSRVAVLFHIPVIRHSC